MEATTTEFADMDLPQITQVPTRPRYFTEKELYYSKVCGLISVFSDLYYSKGFTKEERLLLAQTLLNVLAKVEKGFAFNELEKLTSEMQTRVMAYVATLPEAQQPPQEPQTTQPAEVKK